MVFGTVDSWLLYNLTKNGSENAVSGTEPSNASRTLLYSLDAGDWDEELLRIVGIERENLPRLFPSDGTFGNTEVLGESIPITGILGDQQAALFGHGCTELGSAKCTFGTGAFLLVNQGAERVDSSAGVLTTAAWTCRAGAPQFALEGSVFSAGALIQCLRDNLGVLRSSEESETLAASVDDNGGAVVVPAFVGLGSPHWDDQARGTIMGLSRDTSAAHIVRASLEAIAHQVADILEGEEFSATSSLKIDGGMSRNSLFNQILADLTACEIVAAPRAEITALGAAGIAALGAGVFKNLRSVQQSFLDSSEAKHFQQQLSAEKRECERKRWKLAVERSKGWNSVLNS